MDVIVLSRLRSTWCWLTCTGKPVRSALQWRATKRCSDSVPSPWMRSLVCTVTKTPLHMYFYVCMYTHMLTRALPELSEPLTQMYFLGLHGRTVCVICSLLFPLGLLSLSVKGAEVASMTMDVIQSIPNLDWLSVWIKAYAFIHAGDNQRAINTIWWAEQPDRISQFLLIWQSCLFDVSPSLPHLVSALLRRSLCCGTTWTSWWAWQMSTSGPVTPRMPSSNLNKPRCWTLISSKVCCRFIYWLVDLASVINCWAYFIGMHDNIIIII